jgi:hypothetical protein
MSTNLSSKAREVAATNADWLQVILNGGPPCFHLEGERFCLRAQRWAGHIVTTDGPLDHKFVSFAAALREAVEAEREACLGAFSQAYKDAMMDTQGDREAATACGLNAIRARKGIGGST